MSRLVFREISFPLLSVIQLLPFLVYYRRNIIPSLVGRTWEASGAKKLRGDETDRACRERRPAHADNENPTCSSSQKLLRWQKWLPPNIYSIPLVSTEWPDAQVHFNFVIFRSVLLHGFSTSTYECESKTFTRVWTTARTISAYPRDVRLLRSSYVLRRPQFPIHLHCQARGKRHDKTKNTQLYKCFINGKALMAALVLDQLQNSKGSRYWTSMSHSDAPLKPAGRVFFHAYISF